MDRGADHRAAHLHLRSLEHPTVQSAGGAGGAAGAGGAVATIDVAGAAGADPDTCTPTSEGGAPASGTVTGPTPASAECQPGERRCGTTEDTRHSVEDCIDGAWVPSGTCTGERPRCLDGGCWPPCEEDDDPNTTVFLHELYGCGVRFDLPNDDAGAWIEFEQGIHFDEQTGLAWFALVGSGTYETNVTGCAELAPSRVRGWRVPTIDETRALGAGCETTEPGGRCPLSDPGCLFTSCVPVEDELADCLPCLTGDGPGENGTFCRPNVRLCEPFLTSSNCEDCAGEHWLYGTTNAVFLYKPRDDRGNRACVREDPPGFACTPGGCVVIPHTEAELRGEPVPVSPLVEGACCEGETRCVEQVPQACEGGAWVSRPECNGGTQRCVPETATCGCEDDGEPATTQWQHERYGCAYVWDLPEDPKGAWTRFDSGIHYDADTGLAWVNTLTPTAQPEAAALCEGFAVAGVTGWRLPTIDDVRSLAAGCPATETGGTCPITDPNCLTRDCGQGDLCMSCVGRMGPGPNGTYLRPNVHIEGNTYTSSLCEDCAEQVWAYGVGNGNFATTDGALLRGVHCVRDGLAEL